MKLTARLLLSALLAAGLLAADRPHPVRKFVIQGHVAGLGPSHHAVVDLISHGRTVRRATTRSGGDYVFRNVLPGSYTVRPYHEHFRISPSFRTVAVTHRDHFHINFTAHPVSRRR
jgi:hypothetical protein